MKGQSGNPHGRPKAEQQVKELARQRTRRSILTLSHIAEVGDKVALRLLRTAKPVEDPVLAAQGVVTIAGDRDDAALMKAGAQAAVALLDRGWGRPAQQLDVTHQSGDFIVQHRYVPPGYDPLAKNRVIEGESRVVPPGLVGEVPVGRRPG